MKRKISTAIVLLAFASPAVAGPQYDQCIKTCRENMQACVKHNQNPPGGVMWNCNNGCGQDCAHNYPNK